MMENKEWEDKIKSIEGRERKNAKQTKDHIEEYWRLKEKMNEDIMHETIESFENKLYAWKTISFSLLGFIVTWILFHYFII